MRQSFAWLSPLLVQIPFGDKVSVAYHKFASERVMARKAKGAIVKDLFYHLVSYLFLSSLVYRF